MDCKVGPGRALGAGALLTVVAALENTIAPWAPFYVVYATLACALPLATGAVTAGGFRRPRPHQLGVAIGLAIVLQGIFRLITAPADLAAMFQPVLLAGASRLGMTPEALARRYVLFIQVWAGLGEEIFYRGYVQRGLRVRFGRRASLVGASLLFALRHDTQLLLAWRRVAWGSATLWVTASFVVGLGLGWLYEKYGSLTPSVVCHYAFNLLA